MIGIDIVKIERIQRVVDRRGELFLQKFLSKAEIADSKNISSIAAKWAAKEAASKALGCGICANLRFLDMEIKKDPLGAPKIFLSERAKNSFRVNEVHISITHDGEYAAAAAFVYPPPTN